MSRNYIHYESLQFAKAQKQNYDFSYNEEEYFDRINSYKIRDAVDIKLWDGEKHISLQDLFSILKYDFDKAITLFQDYAENKLFEIYHDKLLWMAHMSDNINIILRKAKTS